MYSYLLIVPDDWLILTLGLSPNTDVDFRTLRKKCSTAFS